MSTNLFFEKTLTTIYGNVKKYIYRCTQLMSLIIMTISMLLIVKKQFDLHDMRMDNFNYSHIF